VELATLIERERGEEIGEEDKKQKQMLERRAFAAALPVRDRRLAYLQALGELSLGPSPAFPLLPEHIREALGAFGRRSHRDTPTWRFRHSELHSSWHAYGNISSLILVTFTGCDSHAPLLVDAQSFEEFLSSPSFPAQVSFQGPP
jgi:hypothetical protein